MDLVIFYSPDKATMTYYINNDSAGYKIEYPFSHIKNVTLEAGDQTPNANGTPQRPGGLVVELNRPPLFWMDSSNSGGFYQCSDFTEDQQASRVMVHHLGGHPKVLSVQLAKLVSLEAFQNRLAFNYAVSAPVSPPQDIHRPASQPNQFPLAQLGVFPDTHLGVGQMPRGHKRQRSRSVPAAVDFSYLQSPMAPFQMQPPVSQLTASPNIFAPVPQHHAVHGLGNNLRIDTASTYGMDVSAYPMSAATTTTISDYASPSFFSTAPPSEHMPMVTNSGSQYNVSFVSPSPMMDQSKIMSHPPSTISSVSHADPFIADQSPPLSNMHSAGSADMFTFGGEQPHGLPEDGLMLSEMLSKHQIDNNNNNNATGGMDGSNFDFVMHGLMEHQSPGTAGDYSGVLQYEMIDPAST
jgi:hypothetical protein